MEKGYVCVIPSKEDNGHGQMQGTPVNPTITLAVMESKQEWQIIKNEIQNKSGNPSNE